jgi:glycosyltransferase involved in cell wall biosynthesis
LFAEKNLKALKIILKELPANTRLAFVGDGPERAALQQEYADMPNVKFMVSLQLRYPATGCPCWSERAYALFLCSARLSIMGDTIQGVTQHQDKSCA